MKTVRVFVRPDRLGATLPSVTLGVRSSSVLLRLRRQDFSASADATGVYTIDLYQG